MSQSTSSSASVDSSSTTKPLQQPTKEQQDLASAELKWGHRPKLSSSSSSEPKPESEYSPEEQATRAKLREKGVNPDLKAEMDAKTKGSFWSKVAGTGMGGGWIK